MALGRREEAAAATRRAIIKVARRVFGKAGYAGASLSSITKSARVTTGAMYHHFDGKEDLFLAVAREVEREIMDAVSKAAGTENDPWWALLAGVDATLEMAAKPDIRQIVFVDAPRVIGLSEWRAIESEYAFGALKGGLARLVEDGTLKPLSPDVLAPIVLGAISEAAHVLAQEGGGLEALNNAESALHALLNGLRL